MSAIAAATKAGTACVLLASVFRPDLAALLPDRFRVGSGHAGIPASLGAMEAAPR